jgi:hypothetical protein
LQPLKRLGPTSHSLPVSYKLSSDWQQWILLLADLHWDNPHCDRALLKHLLDEAALRGAGVLVLGDLFCAMQGKWDPRSVKSDVRPEHQTGDYLDSLVRTATDWHAPYAQNILLASPGNHEASILKRHETDLIGRFCERLNDHHGGVCQPGTFAGWVLFRLENERPGGGTGNRQTIRLHYDHGYGGGGPVTRGVIQTNRRAVYLPDADIVVSGHIHESWVVEIARERISDMGKPLMDTQTHICLPTLKEEYLDGDGWHRHTGKPPKPLGGWWIRLRWSARDRRVVHECTWAR